MFLPVLLVAVSGCDIVTADLKRRNRGVAEDLPVVARGRVEVRNVNGRIEVEPSERKNRRDGGGQDGARAGSPEAAERGAGKHRDLETSAANVSRVETRLPRGGRFFTWAAARFATP